jgi:hypothetical protein
MIDTNLKYQIALFGSFEDISPKADILKYFIDAFSDKQLIPTTFQELGPTGLLNRLSLKSTDDVWNIEFNSNRIDIHKSNQDIGVTSMSSLEDFISDSNSMIEKIVSKFPKKFNRLALVTRHLFKEMKEAEMLSIFHNTVKTIDLYKKNEPVEWNNRVVTRVVEKINGNDETFNIISEINRIKGNLKINSVATPIDRVELKFDINTYQINTDYRFDLKDISTFLKRATEIEKQLEAEYAKLVTV